MSHCPSVAEWQAYLHSDAEDAGLTGHAEHCQRCQAALTELAGTAETPIAPNPGGPPTRRRRSCWRS